MKKIEQIYNEILWQALEQKTRKFTQLGLARTLSVSLSTINYALNPLREMGALEVKKRYFVILDVERILYYWASRRNLSKDIIYQTRVEKPVRVIETEMPAGVIFGAYSAYKYRFHDVPADYSEVYVYADGEGLREIQQRFPPNNKTPNLFVLLKNARMVYYGNFTPLAQTFTDLWNIKEWYASDFLTMLKKKIAVVL